MAQCIAMVEAYQIMTFLNVNDDDYNSDNDVITLKKTSPCLSSPVGGEEDNSCCAIFGLLG